MLTPNSLVWRTLKSDAELELYAESLLKHEQRRRAGVKYKVEYLRRGVVRGAFKGSEMMGGFAIITQGPLRTYQFFTEEQRAKIPVFQEVKESDLCEIAGIFFDRSCGSGESIQLWVELDTVLRNLSCRHVIYGYDYGNGAMHRIYSKFAPVTVFKGSIASGNAPEGNRNSQVAIDVAELSTFHAVVPKMIEQYWLRKGMLFGDGMVSKAPESKGEGTPLLASGEPVLHGQP